jgi:hypothetical protein
MARRSVRRSKPPKPKAPILTAEQKRRRIERLKKCIRDLQVFDPQKVQKRFGVPEVFALEAAIDKALLSAFGHGTSAYMRYNRAATLDHGPLITNVPVRSTVVPPDCAEPGSQDDPREAQEARAYFSEGKERSIDLLRKAICRLEDEIAELNPVVAAPPQKSIATQSADEVRTLRPSRRGFDLNATWRRVARWWRGPNS